MIYHYKCYSCECMYLNIAHHPETPYLSLSGQILENSSKTAESLQVAGLGTLED